MKISKKMLIVVFGISSSLSVVSLRAQDASFASVNAELQGKLDTKSVKVGDTVSLRAKDGVKTSDGNSIPRNAKLIGHVTEVKAHDGSNEDAEVAIVFDRAEWKGGKSAAIHTVIQSLSPVQDNPVGDASMGAPSGGGGGRMGGGGGGGGSRPAASSAPAASPTIAPSPNPDASAAPPSGATTAGGTGTSTTTQADGTVVKTLTARPTGISGVFVASDASAPNSGTLFSKGKNLHLDDGTIFSLGIAPAAAK